jgi:hypothetical protein
VTVPRRLALLLVVIVAAVALAAVAKVGVRAPSVDPSGSPAAKASGLQARVAQRPTGGDPSLIASMPKVRLATVDVDTAVSASAGGPPLLDAQGNPLTVSNRMQLAVFEGPVSAGADVWFRISPLSNSFAGPADYVAWLPLHDAHRAETITFLDPPACPDGDGISVLAALDPYTRAACLGAASSTFTGWTWDRRLPTWYRIAPTWLGDQNGAVDSTISLSNRGPRDDQGAVAFGSFELQLPPGLERPPFEFQVAVTAHVADVESSGCVRSTDSLSLVPRDDPRSGHIWCATRMIVEQWIPLLGPEDRPIDAGNPQLHRHLAGNGICAGVGMRPLVFRVDPSQLDPVWLEPAGGDSHFRIIPNFGPGFRAAFTPELVILDAADQVVARDGTPVNPDGELAGHAICATGSAVSFD